MAAISQSRRGIASFGKRFVNQIRSEIVRDPASTPALSLIRRGVHVSVYDKNVDEQVRPTVVPDELIQTQSDKYWGPHPKTGVFGPDSDQNQGTAAGAGAGGNESGGGSALEETTFFRPLENLEKPQPHP